jgi:hypothetical protein
MAIAHDPLSEWGLWESPELWQLLESCLRLLIQGRLHKTCNDPFPLMVALTLMENAAPVVVDRDVELLHRFEEYPCCGLATGDRCCVEMDISATASSYTWE